ncbi:hypothetical protein ASZ78_009074 [Callipepla squamata]|uniref:Uncharacterized protein n=1 Tax=Callipepla squamata TaxID=9009 RepID=A0A226MU30_CALSU|nr:hypothetical protein ASZ78_009074 [Callipepla squamata]
MGNLSSSPSPQPPILSIWILTERKKSQPQASREESSYPTDDQWDDKENQIPTHSKKIRLTDCHFQASNLEKLCAVLKECGSISELELNNNQISLSSVFCLAQSLNTLENIETMNLRPRRTSRWRESFLEHPKHITSGQRFRYGSPASFYHTGTWGDLAVGPVCSEASSHCGPECFVCFSLRDCTVGPEDVTRLCQILTQCTQLTEIDLSGNALSDQSIERLLSFLPCLCQLTLLRLTDCAIGQGQIEKLCRVLEQHGWLAELDLSRNQLGDEGLRFLLDHLHRVPVTCSLNLSHNRISQCGVLHLINAFTTSGSTTEVQVSLCSKATLIIKLTSRDDPRKILRAETFLLLHPFRLTECCFQPEHLEKLWLVLENCTSLTEYISSNNNITVDAVEGLLRSLSKTPGPLKISIEEPWVCEKSVLSLFELAVQARGDITAITICKEKSLFQLGLRFPHCLEKVGSVVSRLNLNEPEIKRACFYQRVREKCTWLQELRWSHVELHDDTERLVSILLPLPDLKKLELTSCRFTPAGIDCLIRGLQRCQAIEELNLGHMKLGDAAIPQLVLGLCEMPSLKRLILNHDNIGDDGCSRLAGALRNMHYVEEINLGHNRIGDPGLINIAAVLLEMQNLKRIDLSGNCPSPAGGEKLMQALSNCKHLEELILSRNAFGDGTVVKLASSLPHMNRLKILHLQHNNIGPAGGTELARALVACGLLEEISLSENDLGEGSIRALSEGLPHFEHLRKIELKLCGITDDASKLLSRGFQQCPAMEEIILSWNALGDGGAQALARILPGMEKLKMLDLEKNRIGACGATKLAEELVRCPEIQFIR